MGIICLLRQPAYGINPAHVAHIAKEIATQVHHDALAGLQQRAIGATGQGRIESFATQSKIIRTGRCGIVARQDAPHENLHTPPEDTEYAQAAFPTHQPFYLYGKGTICHPLGIDGRNLRISPGMGGGRTTEQAQLHLGLHTPRPTNQRRAARQNLRIREAGRQTNILAG